MTPSSPKIKKKTQSMIFQTQVKNSDSVDKGVDTPRGAGTGGVKVLGRKSVSVAPLDKYLRLKIQIYNIYIFRMSASLLTPKT